MTGRHIGIVIVIFALVLICVGGWALVYPSPDPKNIKYVLWKNGLYKMDLDAATGTMVGDPDRDKLVLGKTRSQLRDRFGLLLLPEQASPYLRGCYENSPWRSTDVVFLGKSSWMAVFDGDKAANLVLVKGC